MAWRGWNTGSGRKYGNKKVEVEGETFDSLKEARRGKELEMLEQAGAVRDLRRQVRYELIPTIREPETVGKRGGIKTGKVIERGVEYIADFVYQDAETGETIVEDVKGYRDTNSAAYKVFTIKRKLMLHIYGIRVKEI